MSLLTPFEYACAMANALREKHDELRNDYCGRPLPGGFCGHGDLFCSAECRDRARRIDRLAAAAQGWRERADEAADGERAEIMLRGGPVATALLRGLVEHYAAPPRRKP